MTEMNSEYLLCAGLSKIEKCSNIITETVLYMLVTINVLNCLCSIIDWKLSLWTRQFNNQIKDAVVRQRFT